MSHPNKVRGNKLETEIVQMAMAAGIPARRAWGSDGRSMGHDASVDCEVGGMKVQAKRRKKLADFLQVPEACDMVIFREDRGKHLVLLSYERLLELLKQED